MNATALISEAEYLATTYHPDCDFIDGQLEERNLGTQDHSNLQGEVFAWFRNRRVDLAVKAFVEQRVRVGPGRYRIPDICVMKIPVSREQVFTSPPYIVVEVLSPEDRFPRMQKRFDDYLAMGVPNVWVLDPESGRGWIVTEAGHMEARDRILRTDDGTIAMSIAEVMYSE